jgi:hypothetical protein
MPLSEVNEDRYSSQFELDNGRFIKRLLLTTEYADWLDAVSSIYDYLVEVDGESDGFRNAVNAALTRHYSAYSMDDTGLMVETGARASQAAVTEARSILADVAMSGPDRQFQSAILNLTRRPMPSPEAAIADGVNALEGVARIALNAKSVTLGDAVRRIAAEKGLHGALERSLSSIYGYASDAGGRQGLVGDPDADLTIAEFVVHQCAAGIVLVARLYGFGVE